MTRRLLSFLLFLTIVLEAQVSGTLPSDGILSPEEAASYVQGLTNRGLYDEGVIQAEIFLERYPEHPYTEAVETWYIQGLFALQKYALAAETIQRHLKKFPNSINRTEFLWDLGECLRNTGDYASALPAYEDMLKSAKENQAEEARYRLAVCLEKLGRVDEAKKHLQILADLPPSAEHLPRVYAKHYLATLLQQEGNAAGALAIYPALLELKNLPEALRQNLLLDAAYIAFNPPIQNYQQAEELYGTFLTEYPNSAKATGVRRNLLSCHYALGHYQDFLELYGALCQKNPDAKSDKELDWLAIQSLVATRHFSEALPRLRQLQEDDFQPPQRLQQVTRLVIQCLDVLKLDEELVSTAKRYCQDFPNALDVNDAMLCAIIAEERQGKNAEAIADLEILLPKLGAGSPLFYQRVGRKLATLLNQTGEYKRSADLFLELGEKAPENSTQENYLTKRVLQRNALTPLFQLPTDPRGLALSRQLAASATNQEERLELLQLRYQFALHAQNAEEALATTAEIIPLVTPLQQVNWILQRAQIHRQLRQYSQTADDYVEALNHPGCPEEAKAEILPTMLTFLYYTKRNADAAPYLPMLFSITPQPTLSKQLLYSIAMDCLNASDYGNARCAFQRILALHNLTDDDRDAITMQAAQVEFMDKKFSEAQRLLKLNEEERTRRLLPQTSDALALQAEIALRQGETETAMLYAQQVLDRTDKTVLSETIPRARWVVAQTMFEKNADSSALAEATKGFILAKHPTYSPLCYLIAIQVKERQGDQKKADELRKNLQSEYPNFELP